MPKSRHSRSALCRAVHSGHTSIIAIAKEIGLSEGYTGTLVGQLAQLGWLETTSGTRFKPIQVSLTREGRRAIGVVDARA